jgi:hypothetical protein
MPVITPRLLTNHLATVVTIGISELLIATPTNNPKNRYSCQRPPIRDISRRPVPMKRPQMIRTTLGPYLSVSLPTTRPEKPITRLASDIAIEVVALIQPRSEDMGLKKIPKVVKGPTINMEEIKPAATIV